MPQISVIVPVYKVEPYLHRCVDSILGQSFSDFELILVDDGSPDGCPEICDEYASKDSRVVVIHQQNVGLSAARNAGIDWVFDNSNSQWLTFVDSDDWVHREYLQRLLDAALEKDTSVSICAYATTTGEEPQINDEDLVFVLWNTEDFFVSHNVNAVIACGKLYRKECFRTIRYPVGKLHEDEFTTYKILFAFDSVVVSAAPLYYYYFNSSGIINSSWTIKRIAAYDALEEQIEYFQERGFDRAKRNVMRRYLKSISDRIKVLSASPQDNRDSLTILKSKKKCYFTKYSMQLDPNDELDAWYLTKVFPRYMKIYWYIRAILRMLKIKV